KLIPVRSVVVYVIISKAPFQFKYTKFKLFTRVLQEGNIHLNFLLFLHRLAEEARTNAFESKNKIIKPERERGRC
uniref:Centromere protein W n=1 Tax=Malurus cyaneus samueli TaxID=2593467 RepID=A0A8C5T2G5_9PASS